MVGLTPTQVRLKTGGFRNKKGKVIGGLVLPKDVERDRKAGIVEIVDTGKGPKVRATGKGRKIMAQRVERKGFL